MITGITLGGAVIERLNNFPYVKIQNLLFVDSAQALLVSIIIIIIIEEEEEEEEEECTFIMRSSTP